MIDLNALSQINKIIEQDKISSTYKFALLKSTIDACQRYDNLITIENKMAKIPLGLIIENWIFDYLPFVFRQLRQQNSGNILNSEIEKIYNELFECMCLDSRHTTWEDAYIKIYTKYSNLELDDKQSKILLKLSKKMASTITKMPMKYSGESQYSIYMPEKTTFGKISLHDKFNRQFLIDSFGMFSINEDHYNIFRYMGQSLFGISTIARRWREKTYSLNREQLLTDEVDSMIFKTIFADRNTNIARQYLPEDCTCVWSNKSLKNGQYDIDHLLPYSVWANNDLWNLLPSDPRINSQKSDKIPSPELIVKQKDIIVDYWNLYEEKAKVLFDYQIRTSLAHEKSTTLNKHEYIYAMCEKAEYLIVQRGYSSYNTK
ncbi:MAG: hypothetical protein K0U47_03495 [Epsilonproteobacteria bacterium]|nr:hypothetical protein [Campylobacterota bacterium]